jgi:hypothetical protein
MDWEAAGAAGLAGGVAFMLVEIAAAIMTGQSNPWLAPRAIADIVFGGLLAGRSLPLVMLIALLTHFNLSLLYGRAAAWLVVRRGGRRWFTTGLLFGVVLYLVNYHVLGMFVPRIAAARSASWLFCHLAFGIAAAGCYMLMEDASQEV